MRQRYSRWMFAVWALVSGARFWIAAGLSETSASLNDGGCGSGSSSKAFAWRGAGFAVDWQSSGGCGLGFGPPPCGAR